MDEAQEAAIHEAANRAALLGPLEEELKAGRGQL